MSTKRIPQWQIVLDKLDRADGDWVTLPSLVFYDGHKFIACLTKVISEIRTKGIPVSNKKEFVDGQYKSYYRLG